MDGTFKDCVNLKVSPEIPETVSSMNETFMGCTSLEVAPKIPEDVKGFDKAFLNCSNLIAPPDLQNCDKLQDCANAFYGCTKLLGTVIVANFYTMRPLKILTQQELQNTIRNKLENGEIIPVEIESKKTHNGVNRSLIVENPEMFAIQMPDGKFNVRNKREVLTIRRDYEGKPFIGMPKYILHRPTYTDKTASQCLEEALKILGSEKTVEQVMETTIDSCKADIIETPKDSIGDDVLGENKSPTTEHSCSQPQQNGKDESSIDTHDDDR